jgi:23S rRNA (adenine2503-C2)-methyltransferase
MPDLENLLNLTPAQAEDRLAVVMGELGEPSYRVGQVLRRLWIRPAASFDAMSELSAPLRAALAERFSIPRLELITQQRSTDGTRKFLFRLADGEAIETVAIPDGNRMTLCVSSQAGCALRCAFCATGAMGFSRNLEPFEIAGQAREMRLLDEPVELTNIVFMGMGEPLMNWKAVSPSLTLLNDARGLGLGVLPGIIALGERPEQFRLAISVHAPSDELRQELMPINTKYPLRDVIEAAKVFDRRVTFEYVMLGGVNDKPDHARQLSVLARECRAFVNLIPLHPGGSQGFVPTPAREIFRFAGLLRERGVEVAIRKSRGIDIAAACGQLRVERLGRRAPRAADQHGDVQVA